MEFAFTREQEDLRTTVRSFLHRHSGIDARQQILHAGYAFDHQVWTAMAAQLGLQGLALPESVGGSGAGLVETCIVTEELGRDLYAGPYFSTIAASWVLGQAEPDHAALLEALADGSRTFTVAIVDDGRTWSSPGRATTATSSAHGYRVSGVKVNVTDAGQVDEFVVLADLPEGLAWFSVPADAEGVRVEVGECLDLTRPVGRVTLHHAPARLLVGPERADEVLATVNTKAAVVLAAEMVGGAEAALEQSVSWSLERSQFGRPIGSFQALKHMSADALVDIETGRLLTTYAAWAVEERSPDHRVVASMAKQAASDAFILAASNNIQIHGGTGFTWEHSAHLFLRRARASAVLFGTPQQHRSNIADLLAV